MKFLKKILKHDLISGSFYLLAGSMAANLFAFLLNLFLARNLSYADYGIFASLLSVMTLAVLPANSINTIIVKFATNYFAQNQIDKFSAFYFYCAKFVGGVAIFLFFLFLILAFPISVFLHLQNVWYGVVLALTISVFYLYNLNIAFLQSLLKFGFISFVNSFGGLLKIAVGVILVYAGLRAFGGIWSIFFMTLGSFLIAFIPLRKILNVNVKVKTNINTKEILKYSIPAFLTVLFLTSFTSTDVILAKHFFNAHDAGFYAGLSLIGRVIFYFTAPIPMVMFPLLVKRHSLNQSYKALFYIALVLVLIPSLAITALYFIRPELVVNLFLGGREYLSIAKYLGILGLYLTIFSLVNVCVNFFLSFNETKVVYFVIPAAISQIILISIFHSNFYELIYSSMIVSFILLLTLLTYYYKKFNL